VQGHIQSRLLVLLALNIFLLIVGCLMDIFSAIVVVVPLILPISQAFNIDPLHLGVIFLANLELGYLTPPVGMNLFLASYRFERPLVQVYRYAVPFLLVLAAVVLLITYVPSLTLGVR
jgi:TRAP-type C4-dicarboxylate transport system permease large subunit